MASDEERGFSLRLTRCVFAAEILHAKQNVGTHDDRIVATKRASSLGFGCILAGNLDLPL